MLGKNNNDFRCRLIYKANPVLPNELDFLKFPGLTRVSIIDIDFCHLARVSNLIFIKKQLREQNLTQF
jgi:hypothetical protein